MTRQYNQFKSLLSVEADKHAKNNTTSIQEYEVKKANFKHLETTLLQLGKQIETTYQNYQNELTTVPAEEQSSLLESQLKIRPQAEGLVKQKLLEHYGESFDNDTFKKSVSKTDSRLNAIEQQTINCKKMLHEEDSQKRERHARHNT